MGPILKGRNGSSGVGRQSLKTPIIFGLKASVRIHWILHTGDVRNGEGFRTPARSGTSRGLGGRRSKPFTRADVSIHAPNPPDGQDRLRRCMQALY